MPRPWMQLVDRFCHQYLQLEPDLDYPPDEALRLAEVQDVIYARLFAGDAVAGPPARYRAKTLKRLVTLIEAAIEDWDEHAVSDRLMAALAVLLDAPLPPEAASAQQRSYVTYHLSLLAPRGCAVTLLENRSLVSASGTTGLRTWEAALHLGQYLCLNPSVVAGKRVLELGAGTGYLSILCAKYLSAAHATASDGSGRVVDNLADNLLLNHLDGSRISPAVVRWGDDLVGTQGPGPGPGPGPVEVVLGADVTYDASLMPALVGTLVALVGQHPRVAVYLSATQRNEQTWAAFLDTGQQHGLGAEQVCFAVPARGRQEGPFYDDGVSICICRVSRLPVAVAPPDQPTNGGQPRNARHVPW